MGGACFLTSIPFTVRKGFTKLLTMALVVAASILPLAACKEVPKAPLRISSSPWPGYEPLYMARDLGYFGKNTVNLFELPSSDITMESFRNRSADLATLTLDETLELLHDGMKMRVLVVMDVSNGGDAVMAAPSIKKLADLKGKRIATTNIPLGFYMLSRLLDKAGVQREDVHVFPMPESAHEQFYLQGKADAVITFEPSVTRIAAAGAHKIFDSSDIPYEILDLLVVHDDIYQQRRKEVCVIANQWFKALKYMKEKPDDAARLMAKRLGVSVDEYHAMAGGIIIPSFEENRRLLWGNPPAITEPARKLSEVMLREKQLTRPVDITAALDSGFASCAAE